MLKRELLMRSQLLGSLEDSNVSPKLKTTEKQEVGIVPWFVAFKGVKGRARTLGWDWEELTSFNYLHGPAQNHTKWLVHS